VTFKHLPDDTIRGVTRAIVDLGLTSDDSIKAMTAGIFPAFAATAASGGTGIARVMTLAAKMNATSALVTGEVPLMIWLRNCADLAAGAPEEMVFLRALEQASADGARPVPGDGDQTGAMIGGLDVSALPKGAGGALEITIGEEDDTLPVSFLLRGAAASKSVAKILVHRHFDGRPSFRSGDEPEVALGTGWLITPSLIMTNHHVVSARAPREPAVTPADFDLQGENTEVQFDFVGGGESVQRTRTTGCVASDPELDYALLRIPPGAVDRPALTLRTAPLTRSKDSKLRERVNVLQHPDGKPMRLGFRNNFVVMGSDDRLSYLTDTAGGSSGSPICDDEWFVAALHRGFTTIDGGPVMVWGRAIHQENYGTPIGRVMSHIERDHPHLHAEIQAARRR
jgi:endonuclease G, mitochondrial